MDPHELQRAATLLVANPAFDLAIAELVRRGLDGIQATTPEQTSERDMLYHQMNAAKDVAALVKAWARGPA